MANSTFAILSTYSVPNLLIAYVVIIVCLEFWHFFARPLKWTLLLDLSKVGNTDFSKHEIHRICQGYCQKSLITNWKSLPVWQIRVRAAVKWFFSERTFISVHELWAISAAASRAKLSFHENTRLLPLYLQG